MADRPAWYERSLAKRKAQRRAALVHIAFRAPSQLVLEELPPIVCGIERGPDVKVAQAAGNDTCHDCVRLHKAALPEMKKAGATYWARHLAG